MGGSLKMDELKREEDERWVFRLREKRRVRESWGSLAAIWVGRNGKQEKREDNSSLF